MSELGPYNACEPEQKRAELPWPERVAMLSIHPEAASREDVARMAAELMERGPDWLERVAYRIDYPQTSRYIMQIVPTPIEDALRHMPDGSGEIVALNIVVMGDSLEDDLILLGIPWAEVKRLKGVVSELGEYSDLLPGGQHRTAFEAMIAAEAAKEKL